MEGDDRSQCLGCRGGELHIVQRAIAAPSVAAVMVPFSPGALGSSLLGYWDAEIASSLSTSGSNVTAWRDLVSGHEVAQATADNQPAYSATGINSRPALSFDGSNDYLALANCPFPIGSDGSEIWVLCSQDALNSESAPGGRVPFRYGGVTAEASRSANRLISGGENRGRAHAGDGVAAVGAIDTSAAFLGVHLIRARFESTQIGIGVDGGTMTFAACALNSSTGTTVIGASTAAVPLNFWLGSISVILVTGLLTDPEAAPLTAYLKARGGIA